MSVLSTLAARFVPLHVRLAIVVGAWLLSVAGASWWAYGAGEDHCQAQRKREEDVAERAVRKTQDRTAETLKRIEVQRVEITQPIQREVRERVVYRDCRHSPAGLRGVNAALTGRAQPAGGGELPPAAAAE